jgi:hypothetical protein
MSIPATVPSIETITAGFPRRIDRIHGKPTFQTLLTLKQDLGYNAAGVTTTLGGGRRGHLGLVSTPAEYAAIAPGTPFVLPVLPAPVPAPADGDTRYVIEERKRLFDLAERTWAYCDNVHKALRNQLTEAVDHSYMRNLHHPTMAFADVSVIDLLQHLFENWGQITSSDLHANFERMYTPWNPSDGFNIIIDQLEEGQRFAHTGAQPITDATILGMAHHLVHATGLYFEVLSQWDDRPLANRTWSLFKALVLKAERRLTNQMSSAQQQGYHAANFAAAPPPGFCYSYAPSVAPGGSYPTSVAPGRFPPSVMTNTDDSSTIHLALAAMEARLADQTRIIQRLESRSTPPSTNGTSARRRGGNRGTPARSPNTNYCWTHGYIVGAEHTSATCKHPVDGHITTATRANIQGGSTTNMDKANL